MPGMSGPQLQQELKLRRREIPIVFITGQTYEFIHPPLLEQGTVGFLFKPFRDTALFEAVHAALQMSGAAHRTLFQEEQFFALDAPGLTRR